ncbi:MAG TPA: PP2C family serine/threonine-protein phosphatase, partial [Candidatus Babeliales bacterium]|nr:PP2C family serine/threonine-protein phosphatase [Candidatus Babeliales bacterium]
MNRTKLIQFTSSLFFLNILISPQIKSYILDWGHYKHIGLRKTQEDFHAVHFNNKSPIALFSIFDGHRSSHCAEFLGNFYAQEASPHKTGELHKVIHNLYSLNP